MGEIKFKVGDKVNVFGKGEGVIKVIDNTDPCYGVELKHGGYHACCGHCEDNRGYWAREDQLELISPADKPEWKVLIIPDGDKTLGRLYENGKVVKSVETKKHPDDEYSVEIATKTIMERLFPQKEEEVAPPEPPFKVGDLVRLKANYIGVPAGAIGVICKLHSNGHEYGVDFKFPYRGCHYCTVLPSQTGLFLTPDVDFEKVN